ncbi:MAG TPA: Gfo/Idh/MocA family oxidoreductase [Thermoanaerobaculia bacterium]|nr:Gfo/Idh/MocA family oxidoreductase [Thermoanaerobaculia bacterium]
MTRVGIVGTGYLGRLHARILTEMPEAEAVGFVELRDDVAAEVSSSFGLKRFASIEELLPHVECAVVATTTTAHFEVAKAFLEAGRDVLVEKPITSSVDEGRALVDLAASRGRIIQVGHVERYNPAIAAAAPLLSGVRYVEAERLGVFAGRSLDIDVLFDLMIHDLNLVLSLLQADVVDVRAVGVPVLTEMVDMANVRLQFASGAVANLTASRVSQERVRKVRFFSSDVYLSVDTKEQEVKGFRLMRDGGSRNVEPIEIRVEKKEPLRAELEAFLRSVRERSRPIVSGEDGLAAVALATRVGRAIEESMREWRG